MAQTTWFAGESDGGTLPVWAPLLAVVGSLTSGFMWMYEVVLDDERSLHVYKHRHTRRSLHLDIEGTAWAYQHRHGRSMYREVDLADVLTEVFADWEGLAFGPSVEERALITNVIAAARNRELNRDRQPRRPSPSRSTHIADRAGPGARTPRRLRADPDRPRPAERNPTKGDGQ